MAAGKALLFVLLSVYCVSFVGTETLCAYSSTKNVPGGPPWGGLDEKQMRGTVQPDNKTIRCLDGDKYKCFAAWSQVNDDVELLWQGCWSKAKNNQCIQSNCSSGEPRYRGANKTDRIYFCCCEGNYCNVNVTGYIKPPQPSTLPPKPLPTQGHSVVEMAILLSVVTFTGISILVIISVLFCRVCFRKPENSGQPLPYIEPSPVEPDFDMNDLKILELIGQGRYCNVYKGVLNNREVAVKIFAGASRECYNNELDIYGIALLEHDNVLKFIGSGERKAEDGWQEYMLVTELIHCGSLMSYLKEYTYDWHAMCKLAQTAAAGLAHLHLAATKEGEHKPAIVHRDINSRNILVRTDGTCCIGDFGFAMKVCGSSIVRDGNRDNSNITDVGTVRYMAPEVLDGAVNLRDCECALKQVDIYSLGLVLWELATRCKDLYPGTVPPSYKLPFQDEVGLHPSFAEMQVLVCTDRGRPAFPDEWKDNHMALRSLKDTIEECWDHDAEARLTALCVEERIIELMVLWDKHRSLTPTINPTSQNTSVTTNTNSTTVPRTVEELEPFLNRENRILGNQVNIRPHQEILPYSTVDSSRRFDRGGSSGMEKNERQNLLSPDTVSTSLSSPSELNLIDFTCGSQAVDPKNIHHSDDSIERFTTDLKYGPVNKTHSNQDGLSHQEASSVSEPTISPSQGLIVNEMPPPLSRDQMTDNLSSEGRRRPWQKGFESACHLPKSDVNRQRQLAKAAEQKPPSYEQVTGGTAGPSGSQDGPYDSNINKRPSSLPLTPDTNAQKKKMMAVYIPDCGPSTRVQTGIAHLDNLDNPCQATLVVPVHQNGVARPTERHQDRVRPASWNLDASGDSEQSMSEESSRSSRSSSAEDINRSLPRGERRKGTPYRILDDKLSVSKENNCRKDNAEVRPKHRKSNLEASISNNNVSDSVPAAEGFGLIHNGATEAPVEGNRVDGKQEYQVSMV
ncbi:Bone morphogenetic protein receptor type-2 [Holothuria leucospilota]|uniref:receptor protein serine/threonine kinase n=1 Tax=Holothuria leucospilota TaxID=206669 RepID=A0A9Q1C1X9_HOLLE|nr:Bone morphogenetic protein receptor type-2 [Holothuria leucospilota]